MRNGAHRINDIFIGKKSMSKVTKTFQFGEYEFKLETGEIARQADSAIIASCGDTQLMVTVVNKISGEPRDFMPLTIDVYVHCFQKALDMTFRLLSP